MKLFREESELPNQEWVLRLSVGGITFLKNDWAWLILDVPRPHGDSSMVVIVYTLYGHVWINLQTNDCRKGGGRLNPILPQKMLPQLWEMVSSEFRAVQLRMVLIAVHVHKGNPGLPADLVNFLFHSVRLSDFLLSKLAIPKAA